MGLFGNDKIDGMFEKAKETLKDTTDKTKKAFAESSEQMKQHNAESKNMKAPVEGAIIRYGVTYNGGLAKYPKAQSGEIGLNVLEDCFYLKPTMTTVEWFEEMAIPYEKIKKLEIVERKISNAEWLLSSSRSDMKAMEQKNNIEILKKVIPFESLMIFKNQPVYIKGYGVQNKVCEVSNALQLKFKKQQMLKWKYAFNRLLNDKKNLKNYPDLVYYENLKEILNELYHNKNKYSLFENNITKIEDKLIADNLNIEEIEKVIIELLKLYHCNSENANLKDFGLGDRIGRLSGINITNGTIISRSSTGIKEKYYEF